MKKYVYLRNYKLCKNTDMTLGCRILVGLHFQLCGLQFSVLRLI